MDQGAEYHCSVGGYKLSRLLLWTFLRHGKSSDIACQGNMMLTMSQIGHISRNQDLPVRYQHDSHLIRLCLCSNWR